MIPLYEEFKTPIIMNIAGSTEDEYCEILEMTEQVSSNIAGYEINISCPNVNVGGMEFGVDCDLTEQLTTRLRKLIRKVIFIMGTVAYPVQLLNRLVWPVYIRFIKRWTFP